MVYGKLKQCHESSHLYHSMTLITVKVGLSLYEYHSIPGTNFRGSFPESNDKWQWGFTQGQYEVMALEASRRDLVIDCCTYLLHLLHLLHLLAFAPPPLPITLFRGHVLSDQPCDTRCTRRVYLGYTVLL